MTPTSDATPQQGSRETSRMRRLAILGGPTTRPISGKRLFPLYGLIRHVGRRSGRLYSTPVVVRRAGDDIFVPLPFGERTDWYRNAVAASGVRATWKGEEHWLASPTVVETTSARAAFNPLMRGLMRFAGITQVVRFETASELVSLEKVEAD